MSKKFQLCGASIITYRGDKVLLQKRTDNGCWAYHGGAVNMGEKVEDAARRELFEETGLKANELELYGVFSGPEQYFVYPDGNEAYIIDIVYLCTDFSGELKRQEEEVSALEWFNIDDIPEAISPPVKPVLKKFCHERMMAKSERSSVYYKLEVYLPGEWIDSIVAETTKLGACRIGNYDQVASYHEIEGCWRPLPESTPHAGEKNKLNRGKEYKLELRCEALYVQSVIDKIREIHPYEEAVINIIKLDNHMFK